MEEEQRHDDGGKADAADVAKRVDDVINDVTSGAVGLPRVKQLQDACAKRISPPPGPRIFDAIKRINGG